MTDKERIEAYVIKTKYNKYWLGGFYGAENVGDIAYAKIYNDYNKALTQCNKVNDLYGLGCKVVAVKITESDIENTKSVEALKKAKDLIENEHIKFPIVYDITDDIVGGCIDFEKCMKIIDNLIKEYGGKNE